MSVNEKALQIISDAEKKKSHNIIYLCEPHNLPELHRLIVEEKQLSADPTDGDIYFHSLSKKWCIHHQGKLKLALAAGVEWDTVETKPAIMQRDYIHYQAVGSIRREYGRVIKFRGDFELDLESLKEDLIDDYETKAKTKIKKGELNETEKPSWIKYCVTRDFKQKRQHRLKLAATGAKSVVIDKLLNLKAGYPNKDELTKPFLIVRCQVAPDLSDSNVREKLSLMVLQSVAGVFGPASPPPQISLEPPIDLDTSDYQTVDEPGPPCNDDIPFDYGESLSFPEMDAHTQIETLKDLARRKGYDTGKLPEPIENMSERNKIRFYDHLMSMQETETDDIPF
jgi:hypothetical protein